MLFSASALTSGTTSGTSESMRQADELSTTIAPAFAAIGLHSRLIEAGVLESTICTLVNASGRMASIVYDLPANSTGFPALRSEARNLIDLIGKFRSSSTRRIKSPTAPVAPTTATEAATFTSEEFHRRGRKERRGKTKTDFTGSSRTCLDGALCGETLMRWSIRYRLLVPLGLLLLGVVATSIWSAVLAASHAKERIARRVLEVTETAAAANYPLTPNVLKQMKGYSGAEYLLAAADGARTSTFPEGPVELPAVAADHADGSAFGPTVEVNGVRYRFGRLMIRNHPNEGATLYIFYPESSLQEGLWDAVRPSLVLGLFGGLAAVAVAIGIGQRLVSRIRELERRTRLIAGGDFSPMPLPRQNDELRDLSASVNEMAQRLAQLREAVQRTERLRLSGQLSSGLAHQIRNSVHVARLALEVLAEEHGLQESEAVGVILRQLDLMEANLRRFMDLGRTEGWKRERCSLMSLIDEAVALLRPQCDHAKIELVWKPTLEPVESEGDPGQLRDLFLNVIHN